MFYNINVSCKYRKVNVINQSSKRIPTHHHDGFRDIQALGRTYHIQLWLLSILVSDDHIYPHCFGYRNECEHGFINKTKLI